MLTIKQSVATIAVIAFLSFSAKAQELWSLQQCIEYALDNNIQLKQQELNVKITENQLIRAKHGVYPNLNASANHNYSFGRSTNYITNQKERSDIQSSSMSISTQVTLFNGFQLTNSKRQEALNLQASLSDVEGLKNNISLNIAAAYLQILFSEEIVESSRMQLELSTMQVERTRMLVDAGSLPEGNLMEMEAQRASDELQLVNAQNQLDLAYLTLTQLLDIRDTENFAVQKPQIESLGQEPIANQTQNIFDQAQLTLPQIQGARIRVQSAEKGVQIAKGAQSPRLSLGANYGTGAQHLLRSNPLLSEDPFLDQIKDNANTGIGLNLSIPIFNGSQVRTSISNARINLENTRLSLENEKNYLFKEIQQAQADAMAAFKKYIATEKNLNALQEAFRYTEQRFSLGLANSLDYTTSKTRLAKVQAELVSAKYEYIFKVKILDFYKGIPLSI
ncbi:MAG: TolC family protein [Bacteroidales bacterium]|mgnify:CR=1 FL=1|nr:TolC family protein [Bacteroidales bacterium]